MTTLAAFSNTLIEVRRAVLDDHEWIMSELERFSDFFISDVPLYTDDNYAHNMLDNLINDHIVFIAQRGDTRLGFKIGLVGPHLYNPHIITLTELFWWVSPEHRGTRAGAMLFREFLKWGKANVQWINASLQKNSPVKEETLLKRGFRFQEKSFVLEIK